MQDKARKNLRLIEEAKTTLLDATKRTAHDSALASGLYDESAQSNPSFLTGMPVMTPPPHQQKTLKESPTLKNAWECPNCNSVSSIGTMYCSSCGNQIGKLCSNCQQKQHINSEFCTGCGINFEEYEFEMTQKDIANMEQERVYREEFFRELRSIPSHRHREIVAQLAQSPYRETREATQIKQVARAQRGKMMKTLAISVGIIGAILGIISGNPNAIPIVGIMGFLGGLLSGYLWCGKRGGEAGIIVDIVLASIYSFLTFGFWYVSWIAVFADWSQEEYQ